MPIVRRCHVVGLGNIGGAVASRLASTGADVTGVDLDGRARAAFADGTGRPVCETVEQLRLSAGERVIVLVRTVEQAAAVLDSLDATGIELTAFVMTTLGLDAARALGARHDASLRVVELPVSGGRQGALDGTLTMMAAGPIAQGDHRFLLDHVAARVVVFDRYGDPTAAKLHNNALAAYHARAHAEVVLSAARHGLDLERLGEVLDHSSGASWMGTNLSVVVDDLLEKDVALFEGSYGALPPVAVGEGSGLAQALAAARQRLTGNG